MASSSSSSSSQAKLTLRAPPHQPFVQGWPGIPAGQGRPAAHIKGTVEVRLGGKGLKASWLRIELRKIESTPTGENWGELIGRGPIEVWTAEGHSEQDAEGNWDLVQTADFPFKIMIPEGLPPSAKLDKQSGIAYEIVTSLCVKVKKGLLRKEDTSSIIQSSHPVTLEKHELHSTWPIYSVPDDHEEMVNQVVARVYRKQTCFGPGDKVELRVILTSKNVSPVKIKTVAVSVRETVTFKGSKRQSRMLGPATKTANQRMATLAQKAQNVGQKLYKGDVKTYDLSVVIPKSHTLMTIQTAKHIEVAYTMRIYVDCKNPIILDHLPLTITTVPRAVSAKTVPQIGHVPGLSAAVNEQQQRGSDFDFIQRPASTSVIQPQNRRQSSGGPAVHYAQPDNSPPSANRRPGQGQPPTRSYSFISSSSSDRTYQAALNRRDTVMTTASGPGLAGRGIPGQIFGYGSYGQQQQAPSPFGNTQGPVRLAFGGPASIYEGRELNPEENRALLHHSAGKHLGEVFEGQDPVPAVNYEGIHSGTHTPSRSHGTTPSEIVHHPHQPVSPNAQQGTGRRLRMASEGAAAGQQGGGYFDSRPPQPAPRNGGGGGGMTASTSASNISPHDAAEMEKERLYRRAREQAERNQRRAAAAAAATAAAAGAGASAGAQHAPARMQSPPQDGQQPASSSSRRIVSSPPAVTEKQILYERARREAERYQAGFAQGATFPKEDFHHNGSGDVSASASSSLSSSPQKAAVPPRPTVIATPTPQRGALSGFPSAEEEKRRLYEAAKAERDSFLAGGGAAAGTSGGAVGGQRGGEQSPAYTPSPAPSRPHSVVPAQAPPSNGFASADEEKRRFEAARAETDAFLRSQAGSAAAGASGSASGSSGSASGSNGAGSSSATAPRATAPSATAPSATTPRTSMTYSNAQPRTQSSAATAPTAAPAPAPAPPAIMVNGSEAAARGLSTAEEEKKALYERAKAEVEASQHAAESSSGSGSTVRASSAYPSAEEEKRRLYEQAKAEVDRHQTGAAGDDGLAPGYAGTASSSSSSAAATAPPRPPASADDEKAQLKRYWEAQDAVARHHQQQQYSAAPSGSGFAQMSTLTSTDPSGEIPGAFPGGPSSAAPAGWEQFQTPDMSREGSAATHAADDSASIISLPYRSPSVAAGKQRSLPSPTASPPPTLPTLSFSSLSAALPGGSGGGGGGGGTSFTAAAPPSSFAPRVASPRWHEEEDEEEEGRFGGRAGGAAGSSPPPPPLPPKTPLRR